MLQQLLQGKKVSFQVMLSGLNKINHTRWVSKAVPVFMIPHSTGFICLHFKDILLLLYSKLYLHHKVTVAAFTSLGLHIPWTIFFSQGQVLRHQNSGKAEIC